MQDCPQCHTSNRDSSRFCKQCGAPLVATPVGPVCPRCGTMLKAGSRFCKQCGAALLSSTLPSAKCPSCAYPLKPQAIFCPHCGTRIKTVPPWSVRPPASGGSSCPNCGTPTRPGARYCRHCSRPLAVPPPPVPPPPMPPDRFGTGGLLPLTRLVGRYVILEKIAQGGMGAIYKARDERLAGKIVAIKEMSESAISSVEREKVLESFQREAELLARLQHPNLVQVSDRFEQEGRHYMVMEFIHGQTLKSMLESRTEPFPEEQVLIWADQLCDVLSYLHSQDPPIIYRDMKPANVMVVENSDVVKLIDFGIARFYRPGKRKDTVEMGTDGYAPPEQYGRAQTDERSDIYALGAMLHHLLTLRDPVTKLFTFPTVASINPKVSRRVSDAIARAVQGQRDKRFASVAEMRSALLGGKPAPQSARAAKPSAGKASPPSTKKAAPPAGSLTVSPVTLDFGQLPAGGVYELSLVIATGGSEQASLRSNVPWLSVAPQQAGDGQEVKVRVDTRLLPRRGKGAGAAQYRGCLGWHLRLFVPAERSGRGSVEVQAGEDKKTVTVTITAFPTPERVRTAQTLAVIAVLLEILLAIGTVGALLIAIAGGTMF